MESQRNLLLLALLFVSFLLYQAWVVDQSPQPVAAQTTEQTTKTSSVPSSSNFSADVPASTETTAINNEVPTQLPTNDSVILENDTLRLAISLIGGDVISADLLEHDIEKDSETPFRILDSGNGFTYIAQSGLIGQGPDANKKGRPFYSVTTDETIIADGETQVSTALRFVDANGNVFTKTFTLKRGEYVINVNYQVENKTDNALNVQLYGQLKESIKDTGTNLMMPVYRGGAYSAGETRYKKYSFDDMKERALSENAKGGWAGMLQHYFASAWIPSPEQENHFYSNIIQGKDAAIGFKAPIQTIQANSTANIEANLWVGPKLQDQMAEAALYLDLSVDYGWLHFIAATIIPIIIVLPRHCWKLGCCNHLNYIYCERCVIPINKSAIHVNGENAFVTT